MIKKGLTVKSDDIENVITRFYYKGEQLRFQIIFRLESKENILYEDFEDYLEYRQKFDDLVLLKRREEGILIKDAIILQKNVTAND